MRYVVYGCDASEMNWNGRGRSSSRAWRASASASSSAYPSFAAYSSATNSRRRNHADHNGRVKGTTISPEPTWPARKNRPVRQPPPSERLREPREARGRPRQASERDREVRVGGVEMPELVRDHRPQPRVGERPGVDHHRVAEDRGVELPVIEHEPDRRHADARGPFAWISLNASSTSWRSCSAGARPPLEVRHTCPAPTG